MLENCDSGEGDLGWKHDRGLAGAASGENILGGRGPILNSLPEQTGRGGSGGSEAGGSRPDEVRRVSRQPGRGRAAAGPGQGPELPEDGSGCGSRPGQGLDRPQVPGQQNLQRGASLSLTLATPTRSITNLGRGKEWSSR